MAELRQTRFSLSAAEEARMRCVIFRDLRLFPLFFFLSFSLPFFIPSSHSNCRLSSRYSRPPQDCKPLQKYQLLLGRLLSFQISRVLAFKCRKFTADFSTATCPGDAGHHIRPILYFIIYPPRFPSTLLASHPPSNGILSGSRHKRRLKSFLANRGKNQNLG